MGMLPGSKEIWGPGEHTSVKRQDATVHPDLVLQAVKAWHREMLVSYAHADASGTEASQLPSTDIPAALARGKHKQIALRDFQLI